ncbi:MAG: hypothetical protein SF028_10365 [Candidatus Sumerlaeia bacterium]|nr:hypothetical protein [Candidatus Sumerlaeia bacterium]
MRAPAFVPDFYPEPIIGSFVFYLCGIALFIAYFQVVMDVWEQSGNKPTLKAVFFTAAFWTVVGALTLPLYALTQYKPEHRRMTLFATSVLGVVGTAAGFYLCFLTGYMV